MPFKKYLINIIDLKKINLLILYIYYYLGNTQT